jgi:polyadenylate-binding protein
MENNTVQTKIYKPSGISICVKNLPTFADDLWLYRRFSQFGAIHSVRAMVNTETSQCMGLGFVNFIQINEGQSAIAQMNGMMVDGKRLVVEMQRPRRKPAAQTNIVVESNELTA